MSARDGDDVGCPYAACLKFRNVQHEPSQAEVFRHWAPQHFARIIPPQVLGRKGMPQKVSLQTDCCKSMQKELLCMSSPFPLSSLLDEDALMQMRALMALQIGKTLAPAAHVTCMRTLRAVYAIARLQNTLYSLGSYHLMNTPKSYQDCQTSTCGFLLASNPRGPTADRYKALYAHTHMSLAVLCGAKGRCSVTEQS